mmetsp:Transcript_34228/g.53390  ORF Transcript_34228/g.53390 Transcript_34228/m.53390 type:complete len:209 (-) Transcript_34228:68-694(-)
MFLPTFVQVGLVPCSNNFSAIWTIFGDDELPQFHVKIVVRIPLSTLGPALSGGFPFLLLLSFFLLIALLLLSLPFAHLKIVYAKLLTTGLMRDFPVIHAWQVVERFGAVRTTMLGSQSTELEQTHETMDLPTPLHEQGVQRLPSFSLEVVSPVGSTLRALDQCPVAIGIGAFSLGFRLERLRFLFPCLLFLLGPVLPLVVVLLLLLFA